MALDIKNVGESLRGLASEDEAGSTIHARREEGDASLTLSVDPSGGVEMTYYVADGDKAVTIHGAEAIVQGPGGDVRYYRISAGPEGTKVEGEEPARDSKLVLSAMAMFDRAVANLNGPEDFKRFNPFEDEPL